jgi:chorismate synthase
MSSNSLGKVFSVTSFGESHGRVIGALIDGCPAGLALSEADLQPDLERRRPGRSEVSTPRREADRAEILAGFLTAYYRRHAVPGDSQPGRRFQQI